MGTASTVGHTNRIIYLDLIRILSIFAVVLIHISACDWLTLSVTSFNWQVLNVYDSLSRWCIPVFIMMSGGLFLHPEKRITISSLYKKNVLRMVAALFFWGVVYYLYTALLTNGFFTPYDVLRGLAAIFTLKARRHLWFLYAITALYLLTPLMRKLIAGKYPRSLWAVSLTLLAISGFTPYVTYFSPLNNSAVFMQAVGFPGMFLLGYCISRFDTDFRHVRLLYAGGIFSLIFTIVGSSLLSVHEGAGNQLFYQNTSPNVVIMAVAMMVYGKNRFASLSFGSKWDKRIETCSGITFAVYLVHDFLIIPFEHGLYGFTPTTYNPVWMVPLLAVAVFTLSFVPAYLIRKIPLINRYIA